MGPTRPRPPARRAPIRLLAAYGLGVVLIAVPVDALGAGSGVDLSSRSVAAVVAGTDTGAGAGSGAGFGFVLDRDGRVVRVGTDGSLTATAALDHYSTPFGASVAGRAMFGGVRCDGDGCDRRVAELAVLDRDGQVAATVAVARSSGWPSSLNGMALVGTDGGVGGEGTTVWVNAGGRLRQVAVDRSTGEARVVDDVPWPGGEPCVIAGRLHDLAATGGITGRQGAWVGGGPAGAAPPFRLVLRRWTGERWLPVAGGATTMPDGQNAYCTPGGYEIRDATTTLARWTPTTPWHPPTPTVTPDPGPTAALAPPPSPASAASTASAKPPDSAVPPGPGAAAPAASRAPVTALGSAVAVRRDLRPPTATGTPTPSPLPLGSTLGPTATGSSVPTAGSPAAGGSVPSAGSAVGGVSVVGVGAAVGGGSVSSAGSAVGGGSVPTGGSAVGGVSVVGVGAAAGGGFVSSAGAAVGGVSVSTAGRAVGGVSVSSAGSAAAGGSVPRAGSAAAGGSVLGVGGAVGGGLVVGVGGAGGGRFGVGGASVRGGALASGPVRGAGATADGDPPAAAGALVDPAGAGSANGVGGRVVAGTSGEGAGGEVPAAVVASEAGSGGFRCVTTYRSGTGATRCGPGPAGDPGPVVAPSTGVMSPAGTPWAVDHYNMCSAACGPGVRAHTRDVVAWLAERHRPAALSLNEACYDDAVHLAGRLTTMTTGAGYSALDTAVGCPGAVKRYGNLVLVDAGLEVRAAWWRPFRTQAVRAGEPCDHRLNECRGMVCIDTSAEQVFCSAHLESPRRDPEVAEAQAREYVTRVDARFTGRRSRVLAGDFNLERPDTDDVLGPAGYRAAAPGATVGTRPPGAEDIDRIYDDAPGEPATTVTSYCDPQASDHCYMTTALPAAAFA